MYYYFFYDNNYHCINNFSEKDEREREREKAFLRRIMALLPVCLSVYLTDRQTDCPLEEDARLPDKANGPTTVTGRRRRRIRWRKRALESRSFFLRGRRI
jgi:hypothetical protein